MFYPFCIGFSSSSSKVGERNQHTDQYVCYIHADCQEPNVAVSDIDNFRPERIRSFISSASSKFHSWKICGSKLDSRTQQR